MKIFFSKIIIISWAEYRDRTYTSNWNVRVLPSELIPQKVPPVGLEPTQALLPIRFSYHYSFHYQQPTRTSLLIRSFWSTPGFI